jgi:hypothetical protein
MRSLIALVEAQRVPILWIGVILVATLTPLDPYEPVHRDACLLCGYGGLADGILNVGLFLPLGAALSVAGWRPMRAVALGALLSSGIETAQLVLPGRDSSFSDIMFNTLGTAVGIGLVCCCSRWWPPQAHIAEFLSIALALSTGCLLALTAGLVSPTFPDDTYYGGWAHRFGHLEWYGGRVLEASLDGTQISPGALANSRQIRRLLISGAAIHVRARAGPPPPGLAPLLTIHDGHQREILLLGIDGDDIVYRYRTRAIAVGLRGPEIRASRALRGIAWRDQLSVVVRPAGRGYCIRVNATEHCGLGFTVGTGWAFLFDEPDFAWPQTAFNASWLAFLFLPIGVWARFGWALLVSIALSLVFLLIMPATIGLIPTPMTEVSGALVGLLAGWAGARLGLA